MTTAELILEARRVLGDTASQRWTDERMLDILNRGIRDIARHGNMYRGEHILELSMGRTRYPLPSDVLKVTSVFKDNIELDILSKVDRPKNTYVSKDQINLGILEIITDPIGKRDPLMFSGFVTNANTAVGINQSQGVVASPVVGSIFGVTATLKIPFDVSNKQPYGIITGVGHKGQGNIVHYTNSGLKFGVLVGMQLSVAPQVGEQIGSASYINNTRVVGRYGFPTVIAPKRGVTVFYKSLPPKVHSIGQAFPLSVQWEDLIVDWLVGTALQDDNDAGNQQRATTFIQRYTRNLESATADSAVDYSDGNRETAYQGGIVKPKQRRRRR